MSFGVMKCPWSDVYMSYDLPVDSDMLDEWLASLTGTQLGALRDKINAEQAKRARWVSP